MMIEEILNKANIAYNNLHKKHYGLYEQFEYYKALDELERYKRREKIE